MSENNGDIFEQFSKWSKGIEDRNSEDENLNKKEEEKEEIKEEIKEENEEKQNKGNEEEEREEKYDENEELEDENEELEDENDEYISGLSREALQEVSEDNTINEEEIEENINEEKKVEKEESEKNNEEDKENEKLAEYKEEEETFRNYTEEDFLDVNDEALLFSGDNEGSVSFDELNDDVEEENINNDIVKEKKTYEEVNNNKKKFQAGKMNKNMMMGAVIAIFVVFLIILNTATEKQKAERKKEAIGKEEVVVGEYNPDFGDYKSRAHKQTEEEKVIQKIKEAEMSIGGKEDFIPDQTPVYPTYQSTKEPVYTPDNKYTGEKPVDERVVSSLGYDGEGFGYTSSVKENIKEKGNEIKGYKSDDEIRQQYIDTINKVKTGVNEEEKKTKGRFSSLGEYEPGAEGGDIHAIPENSIYPGTVIHAVMVNGINTDYPGNITARVINNVYDSRTGKHLLIPSGSILRGSYSSSSIGISRVQIAWTTLIMNRDGMDYYVNLGSMVGIDRNGYSGIKGSLNDHAFQYLKAAGISCLFTYINSNIYEVTNAQKSKTYQEMISDSQEIGNRLAEKILDRALDIQPTVRVKPGTKISVDVDKILTLLPYDIDPVKEKYIRK